MERKGPSTSRKKAQYTNKESRTLIVPPEPFNPNREKKSGGEQDNEKRNRLIYTLITSQWRGTLEIGGPHKPKIIARREVTATNLGVQRTHTKKLRPKNRIEYRN